MAAAGGAALAAAAGASATGAAVGVDSGVAAGVAVADTEQLQHYAACSGTFHPGPRTGPTCCIESMAGTEPQTKMSAILTGP